ncbi:centromere protein T isoform X2 [Lissotriton helveticus]
MADSSTEDLTFHTLIKKVMDTDANVSVVRPATRSRSSDRRSIPSGVRTRSSGIGSPSVMLRSKMKDKLKRTSSASKRLSVIKTSKKKAVPALLFSLDTEDTPRTILKHISQTEPEVPLVVPGRRVIKEPQLDSRVETTQNSTDLSLSDFSESTRGNTVTRPKKNKKKISLTQFRKAVGERIQRYKDLNSSRQEETSINLSSPGNVSEFTRSLKLVPDSLGDPDSVEKKGLIRRPKKLRLINVEDFEQRVDQKFQMQKEMNSTRQEETSINVSLPSNVSDFTRSFKLVPDSLGDPDSVEKKGLIRRPKKRRMINVEDFERRVEQNFQKQKVGGTQEELGMSSSAPTNQSSVMRSFELDFDTPDEPESVEKKGLARRTIKHRIVNLDNFEEAVEYNFQLLKGSQECFIEPSLTVTDQSINETDIVLCNTALYAQPLRKEQNLQDSSPATSELRPSSLSKEEVIDACAINKVDAQSRLSSVLNISKQVSKAENEEQLLHEDGKHSDVTMEDEVEERVIGSKNHTFEVLMEKEAQVDLNMDDMCRVSVEVMDVETMKTIATTLNFSSTELDDASHANTYGSNLLAVEELDDSVFQSIGAIYTLPSAPPSERLKRETETSAQQESQGRAETRDNEDTDHAKKHLQTHETEFKFIDENEGKLLEEFDKPAFCLANKLATAEEEEHFSENICMQNPDPEEMEEEGSPSRMFVDDSDIMAEIVVVSEAAEVEEPISESLEEEKSTSNLEDEVESSFETMEEENSASKDIEGVLEVQEESFENEDTPKGEASDILKINAHENDPQNMSGETSVKDKDELVTVEVEAKPTIEEVGESSSEEECFYKQTDNGLEDQEVENINLEEVELGEQTIEDSENETQRHSGIELVESKVLEVSQEVQMENTEEGKIPNKMEEEEKASTYSAEEKYAMMEESASTEAEVETIIDAIDDPGPKVESFDENTQENGRVDEQTFEEEHEVEDSNMEESEKQTHGDEGKETHGEMDVVLLENEELEEGAEVQDENPTEGVTSEEEEDEFFKVEVQTVERVEENISRNERKDSSPVAHSPSIKTSRPSGIISSQESKNISTKERSLTAASTLRRVEKSKSPVQSSGWTDDVEDPIQNDVGSFNEGSRVSSPAAHAVIRKTSRQSDIMSCGRSEKSAIKKRTLTAASTLNLKESSHPMHSSGLIDDGEEDHMKSVGKSLSRGSRVSSPAVHAVSRKTSRQSDTMSSRQSEKSATKERTLTAANTLKVKESSHPMHSRGWTDDEEEDHMKSVEKSLSRGSRVSSPAVHAVSKRTSRQSDTMSSRGSEISATKERTLTSASTLKGKEISHPMHSSGSTDDGEEDHMKSVGKSLSRGSRVSSPAVHAVSRKTSRQSDTMSSRQSEKSATKERTLTAANTLKVKESSHPMHSRGWTDDEEEDHMKSVEKSLSRGSRVSSPAVHAVSRKTSRQSDTMSSRRSEKSATKERTLTAASTLKGKESSRRMKGSGWTDDDDDEEDDDMKNVGESLSKGSRIPSHSIRPTSIGLNKRSSPDLTSYIQKSAAKVGEFSKAHRLTASKSRTSMDQNDVMEDEDGEQSTDEDGALSEELSMDKNDFLRRQMRKGAQLSSTLKTPNYLKPPNAKVTKKQPVAKCAPKKNVLQKNEPHLPSSFIKQTFAHYAKMKVSKDAYEVVEKSVSSYFEQLSADLEAFAAHAGRTTVEASDVELLMRRQGLVTDEMPMTVLIERYLPLEYRRLLIPVATSGNKVVLQ